MSEKPRLEKSCSEIYLFGILAACNWCCYGDYNHRIVSVKEVDGVVNVILVILSDTLDFTKVKCFTSAFFLPKQLNIHRCIISDMLDNIPKYT